MATAKQPTFFLQAGVEHELIFKSERFEETLKELDKTTRDNKASINLQARIWIAAVISRVKDIEVESDISEIRLRATHEVYEKKWTLPMEDSLTDEGERYPLELASPIADVSSQKWIEQTRSVYNELLHTKHAIEISAPPALCATHVHISPKQKPWSETLDALKAVAKAIVYFERCTDTLVHPEHLEESAHCKVSNFASVLYKSDITSSPSWRYTWNDYPHATMETLWKTIDECADASQLAHRLCSLPKNSRKTDRTKSIEHTTSFVKRPEAEITRRCRWNFRPLLDESAMQEVRSSAPGSTHILGTIEFRQPEGSVTAERAIAWRLFATGFVQAAVLHQMDFNENMATHEPSVGTLWDFVKSGVTENGMEVRDVEAVFRGKLGRAVGTWVEFHDREGYEECAVREVEDSGEDIIPG